MVLVIALIFTSIPPAPAQADAGDLDSSFGSSGKVTTDFFGGSDDAFHVIILPNNDILAVGSANKLGTGSDFALALYRNNGGLDFSFGSSGKVTTDFFNDNDFAEAVAIQPDGKIVVAGAAFSSATDFDFALARYNSNGSLDTSFGSGGKITIDFGGTQDQALGIALQPNGKIILVGSRLDISTSNRDWALARYNSNGSLDTSFGSGGKVTTDFGGNDEARDVALQGNGKIVISGNGTSFGTGVLARYNRPHIWVRRHDHCFSWRRRQRPGFATGWQTRGGRVGA